MAVEKKSVPYFTPEEELSEDGSGEASGSSEDQTGDDQPDFFTWLEKIDRGSKGPNGGADPYDIIEPDYKPVRAGVPEGGS